jgi:hypothetical protein
MEPESPLQEIADLESRAADTEARLRTAISEAEAGIRAVLAKLVTDAEEAFSA